MAKGRKLAKTTKATSINLIEEVLNNKGSDSGQEVTDTSEEELVTKRIKTKNKNLSFKTNANQNKISNNNVRITSVVEEAFNVDDEDSSDSGFIAFNSDEEINQAQVSNSTWLNIQTEEEGSDTWFDVGDYEPGLEPQVRLHEEIVNFIKYLSPKQEETFMRKYTKERVQRVVVDLWGEQAKAHIFGSFSTDLYLPTSDVDLVIIDETRMGKAETFLIKELAPRIKEEFNYPSKFEVRLKAKVPIINFIDPLTGYEVDISVNVESGIRSKEIVDKFIDDCPSLRNMIMLLKHFLSINKMNKVFEGYIGSYGITLMIVSFFQHHPLIQTGLIDPSDDNLGVLLTEFFEYYSKNHNFRNIGISLSNGGYYFEKPDGVAPGANLVILDPENEENNVCSGTRKYSMIISKFISAFNTLYSNMTQYVKHQKKYRYKNYDSPLLGPVFYIQSEIIEGREKVLSAYRTLHAE